MGSFSVRYAEDGGMKRRSKRKRGKKEDVFVCLTPVALSHALLFYALLHQFTKLLHVFTRRRLAGEEELRKSHPQKKRSIFYRCFKNQNEHQKTTATMAMCVCVCVSAFCKLPYVLFFCMNLFLTQRGPSFSIKWLSGALPKNFIIEQRRKLRHKPSAWHGAVRYCEVRQIKQSTTRTARNQGAARAALSLPFCSLDLKNGKQIKS